VSIHIIGTSHVAKQSIHDIRVACKQHPPTIVAVELDHQRLVALREKTSTKPSLRLIRTLGISGYLFARIGGMLQRKIGNLVGTNPGEDMLFACTYAQNTHARLELIDQPIATTLRQFSNVPAREKWKLLFDVLRAPFSGKKYAVNLAAVPDASFVKTLLQYMQERYPHIYRVLVHERNVHMAKRLHRLQHEFPEATILAVVGAGHVAGMQEELRRLDRTRDYVA
jgi:pheromone shutdown protein TraB